MAGKDWYYGFMKRHPNIIVVSNKKLELSVDGAKAFNEAEVLEYCDNRLAQEIIHHVDNTESQNDDGKKISMNKKKRKLDLELASTRRRSTLSRDDDITNGDMQNKKIKEMAPEQYENEKNKSALEELQIQVLKQLGRKTYSGIKKERKGEVFRNVESEPEVTLTAEVVESSDPLEALSVPGPSRQSESVSQFKKRSTNDQLTTLSSDLDIKEEYSVQDSRRTGEETLADFSIVSQDDVSESDISTDDIILSHFRSKAELNSDSSVYFKAQSEKRKQKVTTELLFHRYKLKSKREIDRLHKKIRELKASVQKYKRQVYKLQRRCDNVMGEK
ncbi:hypothetical protein MSG28_010089 [Choristoneura fumiferana]|uniref:Uncharacterized protein n=2 Tax=Choristoneura fumiferana TaxID=7141 RepID=A0ACC0KKA3_CHOFU|nr:hypothetical protein MSG28_010089 [Choristoneura fumiferana]